MIADRDRPIVLDPSRGAREKALLLLYENGEPVPLEDLRGWVEYRNPTRWRTGVIKALEEPKFIHVDEEGLVHLLRPGEAAAEELMTEAA